MKHRKNPNARRPGFTIIELLVVIAIIAVLASLISAAVFQAYNRASVVQAKTEITDLSNALASAKAAFNNVPYLPSRLVLREDNAYVAANIDEQRTSQFLQRAFGRYVTTIPQDWNGNGKIDAGVAFTLQGPTALVFILGGIPTSAGGVLGCTGFSNLPNNPAPLGNPITPGATRKGPFYPNFQASRLMPDPIAPGFLYYTDTYGTGQPYLYFSSYAAGNDYNTTPPDSPGGVVQPYRDVNGLFINGKGFQIISAGKDGLFGPGGPWNSTTGYGTGQPGSDDQSNFSGSVLGNAQS
jgi:prepilin-type N-terminal cleavage/methylation domain-containing protein